MVQMIPRSQQVGGLYVTLKHSTSSTIILGYIYSGVSYVSRELKTESYGVDLLHVPQSRTVTPPPLLTIHSKGNRLRVCSQSKTPSGNPPDVPWSRRMVA